MELSDLVINPLEYDSDSLAGDELADIVRERVSTAGFTPASSPAVSPAMSPLAGGKPTPKAHRRSGSSSLVGAPGDVPGHVPGDVPGYRGKAFSALQEAIAALQQTAIESAWITSRNRNGRTYYRLRWLDGDQERERAIKSAEVGAYQRRIDEGRILKQAKQLAKLLSD